MGYVLCWLMCQVCQATIIWKTGCMEGQTGVSLDILMMVQGQRSMSNQEIRFPVVTGSSVAALYRQAT